MTANALLYTNSPNLSAGFTKQPDQAAQPRPENDPKPPRKPDWLLVIMGVLFLITLLIAWLADIPGLLR